jgi:hypothetical protein
MDTKLDEGIIYALNHFNDVKVDPVFWFVLLFGLACIISNTLIKLDL